MPCDLHQEELPKSSFQAKVCTIDVFTGGVFLNGEPIEQGISIEDQINSTLFPYRLSEKKIIFGSKSDPFFPFESKFETSMRFLQFLVHESPNSLTINTCSPLIIVALPILKQIQDKLHVVLTVYRDSANTNRLKTKLIRPRSSEVLKVYKTFREAGLRVALKNA